MMWCSGLFSTLLVCCCVKIFVIMETTALSVHVNTGVLMSRELVLHWLLSLLKSDTTVLISVTQVLCIQGNMLTVREQMLSLKKMFTVIK